MQNSQNNYPLVSVIVNCHNGETYLKKSINSILNQSYKNFEVIFFDNSSNDESKNIFKSFNDKRLKYFYGKNKINLYKARNKAIYKASGDYITFLDTDDFWSKNFLREHIRIIRQFNSQILYSKYYIKNESKRTIYLKKEKDLVSGYITQNLLDNYSIGIIAVMVRRSIFNKYKFNKDLNIIGDFDFFIKLSLKYKFFALKKALATYRYHSENLTSRNNLLYYLEFKQWYKNNFKLIKKYNLEKLKFFILKLRCKYYFQIIFNHFFFKFFKIG